jgi:hypothetical protein
MRQFLRQQNRRFQTELSLGSRPPSESSVEKEVFLLMVAKRHFWPLWMVFAALVAGCAPIQPVTPTPVSEPLTPVFEPVPSAPITQENTITMPKPSDNPQVMQAIRDLATRLNVEMGAITLVSAEPVVWPDGGLGCPQPGMEYIQVQQDGMRIVLAAGGREYHYHSGETRGPFLCENPASE